MTRYKADRNQIQIKWLANQIIVERKWQRVKSKDSDLKERSNVWFVTNSMKAKVKFG